MPSVIASFFTAKLTFLAGVSFSIYKLGEHNLRERYYSDLTFSEKILKDDDE